MSDIVERLRNQFCDLGESDYTEAADEITRLRNKLNSCCESRKEFMEAAAEASIRAAKAETELSAIKGQIVDPSWVCLDGMSASELAAFDYGSKCCMDALRRILDGEDKGVGTCNEPWEPLRRRVLELTAAIKGQEPVARTVIDKYQWVSQGDGTWLGRIESHIPFDELTPLYALPVAPVADKDADKPWERFEAELARLSADKDAERKLRFVADLMCDWKTGKIDGDDLAAKLFDVFASSAAMAKGE